MGVGTINFLIKSKRMTMVKCDILSSGKANSLYWLGRYSERVYLELHLLRKCFDLMIDGNPNEYEKYYKAIGATTNYPDKETAKTGFVYDKRNPNSIISSIESVNDNAIILRDEITSQSLAYIQMSLEYVRRNADKDAPSVSDLQTLTDWILAFWGSIEERVYNERVLNLMLAGKLVEHIDMNIRFDYKFYRISEAFEKLDKIAKKETKSFCKDAMLGLKRLLTPEMYDVADVEYKYDVLGLLGRLVTV